MTDERQFIIWDERDGDPRRDSSGEFVSDGLVGRIGIANAYITAYPSWMSHVRPSDLDVGQYARAKFSLSGTTGVYRIYRVR